MNGITKTYFPIFGDRNRNLKKLFSEKQLISVNADFSISEVLLLYSGRYQLRGMHFQKYKAQNRMIFLCSGKLYLVVADITGKYNPLGTWNGYILDSSCDYGLYIPECFATGTLAMEDSSFLMLCDDIHADGSDAGFKYDDANLNIDWLIPHENIKVSEKDSKLPSFLEARDGFRSK